MSPHREAKIIAAVGCPVCHARVGQPCHLPQRGRLVVHPERKAAWQAARSDVPVDFVLAPRAEGSAGQRTLYTLVAPQSVEARRALIEGFVGERVVADFGKVRGWTWIGGALRVPHADMPGLAKRLIAEGWQLAEALE